MLGFVDPYINTPATRCFNEFMALAHDPVFYHSPAKTGIESLISDRHKTKAYIIVGSASNMTDPLEWHVPMAAFFLEELKLGKPVLACCFGHQLLAHAMGSTIENVFESSEKLLGLRSMVINQDFWNFNKDESFKIPISHRQVVKKLGPELIYVGGGFLNDIVIHRNLPYLGTQGHPEASHEFCANDIKNLSFEDEKDGRREGKRLIQKFFNYFDIKLGSLD